MDFNLAWLDDLTAAVPGVGQVLDGAEKAYEALTNPDTTAKAVQGEGSNPAAAATPLPASASQEQPGMKSAGSSNTLVMVGIGVVAVIVLLAAFQR
jgi:hypothetical protein